MTRPCVVHLVDDTTAGGVMRVLDHITTSPEMARSADHRMMSIDRGRVYIGHIDADIIVSHLAISWRAMPMLAFLRVQHPATPLVHVEHSYTEAFVALNVLRKRRFAALLRMAYGVFNRVIAVSHAQGEWLVRSRAVKDDALCIIPSCVDLSAFRVLASARASVRVIGAIGRLDRQKGFDTLIKAFRNIADPDISLHIHGEGPQGDALRVLAGDDARIRFFGFAHDPLAAMASVDLVAMPSNWEAFGLVAIEALAARRCLLVNTVDGLVDHVSHGALAVTGMSVKAWQLALEEQIAAGASALTARTADVFGLEQAFSNHWQHLVASLARGESHCTPGLAL